MKKKGNVFIKFFYRNKCKLIIAFILITIIFYLKNINVIREGNDNISKVIVTMSTTPERIEKETIDKTLKSLSEQTIIPDIVYINVPKKSKTGVDYPIEKLKSIVKKYNNINFNINVVEVDMGPITKIIPTLPYLNKTDNVILVDDDVRYIPKMIEQLINTKEVAVGFAGRNSNLDFVTSTSYSGPVEFLETYAGVLYKGELLIGLDKFNEKLNSTCSKQDDIIIGKYLKNKKIVPQIGKGLKQPGDHDAQGTVELRTTNLSSGNKDCYSYISKQ